MESIFVHGANRAFIIEERTRGWVDTTTGSRHYCLRHCSSGSVLWGLWEETNAQGITERRVSCDLLMSSANGWGYRALLESDDLQYLSCPLAYLRESVTVSQRWRERVAEYWRTPLRTGLRIQRLRSQQQGKILQEGDRVRFIRMTDGGDACLGTVTPVSSSGRASIHADELCRTTFIKWDDGRVEPVFIARLERVEEAAAQLRSN